MLWHPILDSMNSLNNRILAGKALLSSRTVTAYRNVDMLALETGQHGLDNFSLGSLPGVTSDQPSSTTKLDRGEAITISRVSRSGLVGAFDTAGFAVGGPVLTRNNLVLADTVWDVLVSRRKAGPPPEGGYLGDLDPVPAGLLSISELLRTL